MTSAFSTIRARLIAVFAVFLVFISVLAVFFWWSVSSIRGRLYIVESFEDLFNNILEARRFEKNFLFYQDAESLDQNLVYVKKVVEISDGLSQDMIRVVGPEAFGVFHRDLANYQSMMETYLPGGNGPSIDGREESIRTEGKAIVDFASKLLRLKRDRIHQAITSTGILPFAFMGILVLLVVLLTEFLSKKVLKPLSLIRMTIGHVAEGDFCPIPYQANGKDEISQLITAFNQMSSELESKQEQLVQSRKIAAIGTFTAGIAHELNNPINNIYLTAETLLEDYEELSKPEGKELVLDILNQAERAGEIIKNLLDFSRSERPTFQRLAIKEVIEKTLKLVKNQILLAGISLEMAIPKDLPPILGHLRNLEQVFLNLFLNAIQAMPGGGKIQVRVQLESHGFIRVDVQDRGTGMKSEQLERIFEPFYTTKSVGRGTGLGLAVSYALIKRHKGHIEVQSELNKGTTFSVYLPVEPQPEAVAAS